MLDFKKYLSDKRWVLLGLVLLGALFVVYKVVPWNVFIFDKPIKMTLSKSRSALDHIATNRDVDFKQVCAINTADFRLDLKLYHNSMGNFGATSDFYLDLETDFEVREAGYYRFDVYSDDGFQLFLNGQLLSEFNGIRATELTSVKVELATGRYSLHLAYFQGNGPMSLRAFYQKDSDNTQYLVGQSSRYFHFIQPGMPDQLSIFDQARPK